MNDLRGAICIIIVAVEMQYQHTLQKYIWEIYFKIHLRNTLQNYIWEIYFKIHLRNTLQYYIWEIYFKIHLRNSLKNTWFICIIVYNAIATEIQSQFWLKMSSKMYAILNCIAVVRGGLRHTFWIPGGLYCGLVI